MENNRNSGAVNDLVMMSTINESSIVSNLKKRYDQDQIYTNIGPVLISVNPFRSIPGAYTDAVVRRYKGRNAFELQPHLYALADQAYRNMISYTENQCIIITGESGSGKTEASKIVMQFISACTGKGVKVQSVKEKLLASNPVLEAFGNAKTVNNDNSSRFGKYMKIEFSGRGDPVGGSVNNYLLEKIRVVGPAVGERSFHIFYQICAGLDAEQRRRYNIGRAEDYAYLNGTQCFGVEGMDDSKEFNETFSALQALGVTPHEIDGVLSVLSAILWLGNLTFQENHQEQSSVVDRQVLDLIASLLQVSPEHLEYALCQRTIQTGQGQRAEIFHKPLTANDAYISRDTLAKSLYEKLFNWIVLKVNQSISIENSGTSNQSQLMHIGLLDIYGFEIFQSNSFEQLCINFVNERLQQIFIDLTLKAEQEEYEREGIPWDPIQYYNNLPCVEMIQGRPGLLTILDDACHTSKSDVMFVNDVSSFFSNHSHVNSSGGNRFSIAHYAGTVEYDGAGFILKNKDTLFDDLVEMLQTSTASFVHHQQWMEVPVARNTQKKKPPTVGKIFKTQVEDLMTELHACSPHYVRCIKPNTTKRGHDFNVKYTAKQVQYLGLLENVRVRRAGYATRLPFDRFIERFGMLSDVVWNQSNRNSVYNEPWRYVQTILAQFGWADKREYSLGQTKVFVRAADSVFRLEDARETLLNRSAARIQRVFKRHRNKLEYVSVRSFCHEALNNRKERRRESIDREYIGDYINAAGDAEIRGQIGEEKLLFADRVSALELRGKRNLFQSLKRVVSKKNVNKDVSAKQILLTDEALYGVSFVFDELTQRTRTVWEFRVPLTEISSVTLSPYRDNTIAIFARVSATPKIVVCRRKVELAGLLKKHSSPNFQLNVQDVLPVQLQQNNGKMQQVDVRFIKDETISHDATLSFPKNGDVEIRVGSGVPAASFPAPPRPRSIDWSAPVRDELEVVYDFAGNGIDELCVRVGQKLSLLEDDGDGWLRAECEGKKGYIPESYTKRVRVANRGGNNRNTKPHSNARNAAANGSRNRGATNNTNRAVRFQNDGKAANGMNAVVPGASRQPVMTGGVPALPKPKVSNANTGRSYTPINKANTNNLKSQWEKIYDEGSGAYYYYNDKTGESKWEKPSELEAY